jgi:4-hydroxy-2-oxoheptanedioate aldolase
MANLRQRLRGGAVHLGLCVCYPAPGIIERIGADWDWLWLDGQHGEMGYRDMLELVRTCELIGRPAFVRVPGHEAGPISQALDMGASAVIVPCVDTPEQAAALVAASRFPPLGNRSYGGRRPIDRLGRTFSHTANDDTLLVVQIESPEAVARAEQIAAVPGVDALFLGPDDLLMRRGMRMDAPRTPQLLKADLEAVAAAVRKHDKFGVAVGVGREMLTLCRDLGYQLIVSGADMSFLTASSNQALQDARAIVGPRPS